MNDPERISYLTDAERFVTTFCGTSTSWSTPHLYISALATWPPKQPLTRLWKPRFMNAPLVQTRGIRNDLILSKLVGSHVYSVAFSPDGSRIVSGSDDKTTSVGCDEWGGVEESCWAHQLGEVCRVLTRWITHRFWVGRQDSTSVGGDKWGG